MTPSASAAKRDTGKIAAVAAAAAVVRVQVSVCFLFSKKKWFSLLHVFQLLPSALPKDKSLRRLQEHHQEAFSRGHVPLDLRQGKR
jgi:hypothetical protein